MRMSMLRLRYLLAVGLFAAGIVLSLADDRYLFDPRGPTGPLFTAYFVVGMSAMLLMVLAVALALHTYVRTLVALARAGQWIWFVLMWVCLVLVPDLYLIALPVFMVAGPRGNALAAKPLSLRADRYANWQERALGAGIDIAVMGATGLALWGFAALIIISPVQAFSKYYSQYPYDFGYSLTWEAAFLTLLVVGIGSFLLELVVYTLVVWPLQWVRTGQSFGQRAMYIKVIAEDGQPLRFKTMLLRSVCMLFLDNIVFSIPLGWFWAIIDPKAKTWHDYVVGTVVVKVATEE